MKLFEAAIDRAYEAAQVLHLQPEDHEALYQQAMKLATVDTPISRKSKYMGKDIVICRCAKPLEAT